VAGGELPSVAKVAATVVFNGSGWDQNKITNLPLGLSGNIV